MAATTVDVIYKNMIMPSDIIETTIDAEQRILVKVFRYDQEPIYLSAIDDPLQEPGLVHWTRETDIDDVEIKNLWRFRNPDKQFRLFNDISQVRELVIKGFVHHIYQKKILKPVPTLLKARILILDNIKRLSDTTEFLDSSDKILDRISDIRISHDPETHISRNQSRRYDSSHHIWSVLRPMDLVEEEMLNGDTRFYTLLNNGPAYYKVNSNSGSINEYDVFSTIDRGRIRRVWRQSRPNTEVLIPASRQVFLCQELENMGYEVLVDNPKGSKYMVNISFKTAERLLNVLGYTLA